MNNQDRSNEIDGSCAKLSQSLIGNIILMKDYNHHNTNNLIENQEYNEENNESEASFEKVKSISSLIIEQKLLQQISNNKLMI